MRFGLRPAIKYQGKIYVGDAADNHETAGERYGIPVPEESRGFSPDGKLFLNRTKALGWLKFKEPKIFEKVMNYVGNDGLHSQHYAKAKGITQRTIKMEVEDESTKKLGRQISKRQNDSIEQSGPVSLKEKTAIVFDRGGLYLYCAEKLAEKYGKVMYYLADADAYPSSQKHTIGMGISNVKRIHDFWKYVDDADIVYFFDCYDGELQHYLRGKGYTVFGSGRGEQVEIDKIGFLETLEELNLPCPKTYLAEGMEDLKTYLEKNDGQTLWLKNLHRGDFETRKFKSMAQIKPFLDDLRTRIGSASDTIEVLCQHKIDSECEAGYDGFQVDGEFTNNCIIGYEIKDVCFVAKVFDETPEILKGINDAFSGKFKKLGYRGNYSTEIRITKESDPYYIDATCRVPSPPGELMCEMYENWAEATWDIANGILPTLKPIAKFGAEVMLTSEWYDKKELHVTIPKKYRNNVKLKNHTVREGEYFCIPNGNGQFFGAIVAWGNSVKEAIENVKKIAEEVEADDFKFDESCFNAAFEAIEAGEKFGICY